jgi:hypothetical protein
MARSCRQCGAAERQDSLGWSNLGSILEVCVTCINEQIQRFRERDARRPSSLRFSLSPEPKEA